MGNTFEIRKDNVKEAANKFNATFRFTLIFMAVLMIIGEHGVNSSDYKEMVLPLVDVKAPTVLVTVICLVAYSLSGCFLLFNYWIIKRNLDIIEKDNPEEYTAIKDSSSWAISAHYIVKALSMLIITILICEIMCEFWPGENDFGKVVIGIILSIPYIFLGIVWAFID